MTKGELLAIAEAWCTPRALKLLLSPLVS